MQDCLIIGGGVIGLSLAYELAGHGQRVVVLDRGEPGREASWAGAGILPPGNSETATDSYERLAGLSGELHPQWAAELRDATGIDTGYRRCGGIHIANETSISSLEAEIRYWRHRRIEVEPLASEMLADVEPALTTDQAQISAAYLLPGEAQLRNPWHLRALLAACAARGVTIRPNEAIQGFDVHAQRMTAVRTASGSIAADAVCITSGAWTAEILRPLGPELPIRPVRGQIVLFHPPRPLLRQIVNCGARYLVPRDDGRLLAGSTEEDVGFDKRTTSEGVAGLIDFATQLVPALTEAKVERTWAGLRPGTPDGLPYLGRVPGFENLFIAAGHYRSGLSLSPATAVVMSRLIRGDSPGIDLSPFRLDRSR
jgi:glycine oxidase